MLRLGLVGTLILLIAAAASAYGSSASQRFFLTKGPDGASCEIDVAVSGLPTSTWCAVGPPHVAFSKAVGVRLSATGHLQVCHGGSCVGNAPAGAVTSRYGQSISFGPFRCTSLRQGVRCVVTKSGHGFVLSARGVTRV